MALRQRLLRDIAEMRENPYPNIKFIPYENDITKACLILTPNGEAPLHLTILFRDDYPLRPPTVKIQSYVIHPNVMGDYICASILNTTEGYTPAYTLKGICIQLLSFFGSDNIEQDYGGTADLTRNRMSNVYQVRSLLYECKHCDIGRPDALPLTVFIRTPSKPHARSAVVSSSASPDNRRKSNSPKLRAMAASQAFHSQQPKRHMEDLLVQNPTVKLAELSDLPDEILVNLCEYLETEELAPLSRAWHRIGSEKGIVSRFNVIRNRELVCFCLKKDFNNAQLGIGVHVGSSGRLGKLESEFDLLSLEAFEQHHVRRSVQGLPFDAWLPLPISRRHYNSVKHVAEPRLLKISQQARFGSFSPVEVIYAFMNDIVVRLSTAAESDFNQSSLVHASEKAIESYYHLFHLLLCLATEDPRRVRTVNQTIKDFLDGKTSKVFVPNLGFLLIAVLISDADMTVDLLMAIIRETVTRNVVWMLDKRGANMPELCYIEADTISHYRLQKTFDASKTSYRLLMFLNLFRQTINRGNKSLVQLRDELFDSHGAPPRGTAAKLANDIKQLQQVKNFPAFIKIMGLTPPPASQFTSFLRNCVEESMREGYSVWGISQQRAFTARKMIDPEVQERNEVRREWQGRGTFQSGFFPGRGGGGAGGRSARGRGG
ncbi:hypothetical protein LTR70_008163 [Exophiala xenobiotica]|uniref:UBC core domain-containing protein n=1 Tax=Lithohypha guttulata TaxID=1690604 RepID=A0ABR0K1Z1_9EURO|nr:hypothetical protein LTR24_007750 [Lithohypha guttulata]KAK5312482.1 hypothetical protein LTR70_008163 [Exophiala xenobiotica]